MKNLKERKIKNEKSKLRKMYFKYIFLKIFLKVRKIFINNS